VHAAPRARRRCSAIQTRECGECHSRGIGRDWQRMSPAGLQSSRGGAVRREKQGSGRDRRRPYEREIKVLKVLNLGNRGEDVHRRWKGGKRIKGINLGNLGDVIPFADKRLTEDPDPRSGASLPWLFASPRSRLAPRRAPGSRARRGRPRAPAGRRRAWRGWRVCPRECSR